MLSLPSYLPTIAQHFNLLQVNVSKPGSLKSANKPILRVSQYEYHLKKWGIHKNLKMSDWKVILPVYNDLKERGLEPRVRVGGYVLNERRVKRAQRYIQWGNVALEESVGKRKLYVRMFSGAN